MPMPPSILSSERLIFRLPLVSDLHNFHQCFEDEDAMKYYLDGFSATIDESEKKLAYVLNHWDKYQCGDWVVIEQQTGEFIGFCGFDCEIEPGKPNLGFAFLRNYWGKGYATEAVLRVIQHGFQELGFDEIRAYVHAENKASLAVLTKCKMTFLDQIIRNGQRRLRYTIQKIRDGSRITA